MKNEKKIKITKEKTNGALQLVNQIEKVIKRMYKPLFHFLLPARNNHKLKYGLYFLSSCISKIQNKNKSFSYNSIIRQKHKPNSTEIIFNILKILFKAKIGSIFQVIKIFSINKKNKSTIKIILIMQAIQEKIKYRQVIRGYNSFKRTIFNKSMVSDFGSDKSFSMNSMLKVLVTPPSESPTFDLRPDYLGSDRSSCINSALNTERRSSLHSFQQSLIKKFTNKISQESKSGVVTKPKILTTKNKGKESVHDKRFAYAEALKERQKKKIGKYGKETNMPLTSRKISTTGIGKKKVKDSLLDAQR